jgi:hypothetical protein
MAFSIDLPLPDRLKNFFYQEKTKKATKTREYVHKLKFLAPWCQEFRDLFYYLFACYYARLPRSAEKVRAIVFNVMTT